MDQVPPQRMRRAGRATVNVLRAFEANGRRPMYAYEIVQNAHVAPQSVTQVFERFEEMGWLTRGDPTPTEVGPPRTYWSLTKEGNEALDRLVGQQPLYEPIAQTRSMSPRLPGFGPFG